MPLRTELPNPLELAGGVGPRPAPGEKVGALLLVKKAGYVPAGVTPRARIDEYLFTCSFQGEALPSLARDPWVQTIALAQPLRPAGGEGKPPKRLRLLRQALENLAQVVEQEQAALPVSEQRILAAWLQGLGPAEAAERTGVSPLDVRKVTYRFRFRPRVWAANQRVREVVGNENLSSLAGVLDFRNVEVWLLDEREAP